MVELDSWQLTRICITADAKIDPSIDTSGFYNWLQNFEIDSEIRKRLPSACDRFEEARFYIQLLASLQACDIHRDAANWCLGAHFSAYIGIDEAAKYDFERLGKEYRDTPLSKEFWLQSNNPDPRAGSGNLNG